MPRPDSPPTNGPTSIRQAVRRCQQDKGFMSALSELYQSVDLEISKKKAICLGGGACCKFDLAGHRLYLSTGEVAILTAIAPPDAGRCLVLRCPYQFGPRCAAHEYRPLGCRAFFCSRELQSWSRSTYENYHRRIRQLHEMRCLPYTYAELTAWLSQLLITT